MKVLQKVSQQIFISQDPIAFDPDINNYFFLLLDTLEQILKEVTTSNAELKKKISELEAKISNFQGESTKKSVPKVVPSREVRVRL